MDTLASKLDFSVVRKQVELLRLDTLRVRAFFKWRNPVFFVWTRGHAFFY